MMSRRVKIILCLSLLGNLLVIGCIAGFAIHKIFIYRHISEITDALHPENSRIFREITKNFYRNARDAESQKEDIFRDMQNLLQQKNFDTAQFEVLSEELTNLYLTRYQQASRELGALIVGMSHQERMILHRSMTQWLTSRHHHRHSTAKHRE